MTIPFIDLKSQYQNLKSTIDARIQRVLDHGQYIMGPEVAELEQQLAAQPRWMDKPSCLGRWDTDKGKCLWIESEEALRHFQATEGVRYCGPIPEYTERS